MFNLTYSESPWTPWYYIHNNRLWELFWWSKYQSFRQLHRNNTLYMKFNITKCELSKFYNTSKNQLLFTMSSYIGSYISDDVLSNLLNELKKIDKMWGSSYFYLFLATRLINLIIREHKSWILFITWYKHNLKVAFWRGNVKNVPYFTQRFNGRYYVTLLNL